MPVPGFLASFADKAQTAINATPLAGHLPNVGHPRPSTPEASQPSANQAAAQGGGKSLALETISYQFRNLQQQYSYVFCVSAGTGLILTVFLVLQPRYRGSLLLKRGYPSILKIFRVMQSPRAKNSTRGDNLKLRISKMVCLISYLSNSHFEASPQSATELRILTLYKVLLLPLSQASWTVLVHLSKRCVMQRRPFNPRETFVLACNPRLVV